MLTSTKIYEHRKVDDRSADENLPIQKFPFLTFERLGPWHKSLHFHRSIAAFLVQITRQSASVEVHLLLYLFPGHLHQFKPNNKNKELNPKNSLYT